jgi:membrane dipeptidase
VLWKWSDSTGISLYWEEITPLHLAIDHVGIGSDFDGIGYAHPDDLPDAFAYPALIEELLNRGYSEEDIRKVMAENFIWVWREIIEVTTNINYKVYPFSS